MTPILYDATESAFTSLGLGMLNDATQCTVKTVLNGQFELQMTYPVTGKRYSDLRLGRIIKAVAEKGGTPQLFDIYGISKPLNGIITVYAQHVSGRKAYIPVMPCTATTCSEALTVISAHTAETSPFTLWTDKNTVANFRLTAPASLGQVLGGMEGSLLDVYRGEYEFDNFTIKLYDHRGQDTGVTLRYGKNITNIKQEESIEATVTGICPFWADADGNVITLPEKVVYSQNAQNFAYNRTVVMDFSAEFDEEPTVAQLRTFTENYITRNNIGVPKVSIDLAYETLADYEEFRETALIEEVRLGDTVHVVFEPLGITAEARVTSTVYDVLADKYKTTGIGSVKANLSNVLADIQNDAEQGAEDAAETTKNTLEAAFERALELLSGADGGNIVIRQNQVTGKPYEILIMDTDDMTTAQKVLRLNMNGLGLSTNGINGPYTAAITGDGIVATAITTGILNAARIQAGILQSQENANDPSFYLNLDSGVLRGKFSQLSISGQTVNQIAQGVLDTFVQGQYAQDIADLQNQVDGQIETWFDNYVPTLNNAPANTWTTTADKDNHLGDLFYVVDNQQHGGECYRFVYTNNAYSWELVEDSAVATALAEALAAQQMAGEKCRVFVATPVPPYDIGDLWVQGENGGIGAILVCNTARAEGASYHAADWTKSSAYITDSDLLSYDSSLDQLAIFNKLTNNGQTQGLYLYNNKLYVNASYIKSGVLSGVEIIGETGNIGGWVIESERIMKERTYDGDLYRACLYAPATPNMSNAAFYIAVQDTTTEEWDFKIRLQYNGKLIAKDAEIEGSVVASSGNIAGWSLTSTDLSKQVTVSGDTYTLVMRAGDPNNGSLALFTRKVHNGETTYPFSVSYTGQLKATGAEISGSITATGGSIAGWELTEKIIKNDVTVDGVTYSPRMQAIDGTGSNPLASKAFYIKVTDGNGSTYPFYTTYGGHLQADDATITGRIIADSGIIGNGATNKITIGTNATNAAIYNGMTSLSDTSHDGFYIGTDGIALGKGKFKVTKAGALTATEATITGAISAKSGTIGANATNKITIGTGTTNASIYYGVTSLSDTAHNGFYLGSDGLVIGKGVFKVTNAGAVTATNASISGSITATSGTIGGWTINDVRFYKETTDDGVTYRVGFYAPAAPGAGNRAMYVRQGNSDYQFEVYYNGLLNAKNANIKGVITAVSGVIGDGATNKITIGTNATNAAIYSGMTTLADTTHNGFYLGADGIALGKGKFKVTSAGALTATSATITGKITSSDATITGGSVQIETASSTNDSISLTYSNWTTALQPLQLVAWNRSTRKRVKIQAGGIFFDSGVTNIAGEGTSLSSLSGSGLFLKDDTAITRAIVSGAGLWIFDENGDNRITLQSGGLYIKDDDLVTKAFVGASNRNGVVYLYDSGGNIRANLNDGGLYFSGASSGVNYTHYGQHAIDFMPPPSSINSTAYNTGGWIDFHYQRSTADYTSRLLGSSNTTTALPSITNGSDRRMKEDIEAITGEKYTDMLRGLQPVRYKYKRFTGNHYGFVAQDVIDVCEKLGVDYSGLVDQSAVYAPEDPTEYYTLNYIDLIAILVKGYQELDAKICALQDAG